MIEAETAGVSLAAVFQGLQALGALIVGGAGLFIAWQQKRLADIRLRHELFDRRYSVLTAARRLIAQAMREGTVKTEEVFEFLRGTIDASFVLDDRVESYLGVIRVKALRLGYLNSVMKNLESPDRPAAIQEEYEILGWFSEQEAVLIEMFRPFLQLERRS